MWCNNTANLRNSSEMQCPVHVNFLFMQLTMCAARDHQKCLKIIFYVRFYFYFSAGYDSDMSEGATVWARSDELLIVGTVCLFLIPFAIIGLGT